MRQRTSREERRLEPVQVHRHDRRAATARDALDAAAERLHLARARQLALGEDAHARAALEVRAGLAQGVQHDARPAGRRDRDHVERAVEGPQPALLVPALVDQEAHRPRQRREQHEPVDQRHVVGRDQRAARARQVLETRDAHAVEDPRREQEGAQEDARQGVREGARGTFHVSRIGAHGAASDSTAGSISTPSRGARAPRRFAAVRKRLPAVRGPPADRVVGFEHEPRGLSHWTGAG
jgi:hypothetical protein